MSLIDTLTTDAEALAKTLGVQNFPGDVSGLFLALVKRLEAQIPELIDDALAPKPPEPAPAEGSNEGSETGSTIETEPAPVAAADPEAVQAQADAATAAGSTPPIVGEATPAELLDENIALKAKVAELETAARTATA
jgi:hypothetical protein